MSRVSLARTARRWWMSRMQALEFGPSGLALAVLLLYPRLLLLLLGGRHPRSDSAGFAVFVVVVWLLMGRQLGRRAWSTMATASR